LAYALWLAVVMMFNLSISDIADLYASNFHLALPSPLALLVLLLTGAGLGWLGAYASVNRSLAQIE
jgi:cell division transport system permease protein